MSLGAFLRGRRAALQPGDVTVPTPANRRRVAGLRREEAAMAVGISVDYYTRLEQDRGGLISAEVLGALAAGLRLDQSETAYLHDLARRPARPPQDPAPEGPAQVRPPVQRLLDSVGIPAILYGRGGDILAWNRSGAHLFVNLNAEPDPNYPRLLFLDPRLARLLPQHEQEARDTAAHLRTQSGRAPDDRSLHRLVQDLVAGSPQFRALWALQDVHERLHGDLTVLHPVVGELRLHYEVLYLADADHTLFVYSAAEARTPTDKALSDPDGLPDPS